MLESLFVIEEPGEDDLTDYAHAGRYSRRPPPHDPRHEQEFRVRLKDSAVLPMR